MLLVGLGLLKRRAERCRIPLRAFVLATEWLPAVYGAWRAAALIVARRGRG